MEKRKKVAFIILHYLVLDVTVRCIESIQNVLTYLDYQIVVVDNGSHNGTGEKLIEKYEDNKSIKVICLEKNLGFSAGNNVGYRYAMEELGSEFIFVINNDTEMIQSDFIERAIKYYEETKYYVLGPDIIQAEDIHQSPLRDHIITKKEAKVWLLKRYLFGRYLHVCKYLGVSERISLCDKFSQYDIKRKKNLAYAHEQENVELQGACLIFSPLYIENNSKAFEELTFMYCEEALLSLKCMKNRWKIVYNPELKIRHMEKGSTGGLNSSTIDREIFCSKNIVKSIRVVLREINTMNRSLNEKS